MYVYTNVVGNTFSEFLDSLREMAVEGFKLHSFVCVDIDKIPDIEGLDVWRFNGIAYKEDSSRDAAVTEKAARRRVTTVLPHVITLMDALLEHPEETLEAIKTYSKEG